jgi:transcription elongation factor Elf1
MATGGKMTGVFAGLRCPLCGEEASIEVQVEDLGLHCSSCGEDIERIEVEQLLETWTRLLKWIDSATEMADPA